MKPIETEFMGYRFRSRLEARWAVCFQRLGLDWRYEHEGFDLGACGWYLPDFYFPQPGSGRDLFVEIKGVEPTELEKGRLFALTDYCMNSRDRPAANGLILYGGMNPNADCVWVWKDEAVTTEQTLDMLRCLFGRPEQLVAEAIAAGRRARFERGEKPDA